MIRAAGFLTGPSQYDGSSLAPDLRRAALRTLGAGVRVITSPAASRTLTRIFPLLRHDSLEPALRQLDRAWRCMPEYAPTIAPAYGYLLMLHGGDYYAALGLLQRSLEFGPNPDAAALVALALLRLERPSDALARLQGVLSEYCAVPGGILFRAANEIARHPAVGVPGWVGRGPSLELLGELAVHNGRNVLDIRIAGGTGFSQILRRSVVGAPERQRFSIPSPASGTDQPLEVWNHDMPLAGSPLSVPPDFYFDGRVTTRGASLSGWARIGWLPTRRVRLRLEDEQGHRVVLQTDPPGIPAMGLAFRANLRASGLRGSAVSIAARLPDGRWQILPDSPVLLERAIISVSCRPLRIRRWGAVFARSRTRPSERAELIDVIIPVYRGREETLACVSSVLSTIGDDARVIVVDDATDDVALAAALDELSATGRITLLRNRVNQGFVASVNRGMALNTTHDVVLLNSDTLVFDDWLARLRAAAYSGSAVGTVTPLSNSGSITSYPYAQGAQVAPEFAAALHAIARATHPGKSIEIPVGVGYCLYIRRDCLRAIGEFDAVFGRGYGEEVDFCLRARRQGWSQRLAADVYVYHSGGMSFGGRRAALLERSQRIINLRYPGYDAHIASFQAHDPVRPLRRRLDEHRLSAFQGRFVLLVTLSMSGGVERFVTERCREIRAQGLHPLILRPAGSGERGRCELWTDALELPNLRFDIPKELSAVSGLLRALRIEAIEIQHFLHLDARVIEAVRALPVPYDLFVHDYSWICPRVTLIDGSGRYCGEPAVSVCKRCVSKHGSNLGEKISVPALRFRSNTWLRGARRVFAPSLDTATRLQRHFPGLEVEVRPHAAPELPPAPTPRATGRKVLRVAVLGAIGDHKGYAVLLACARNARTRRLPIEFVVIGYTRNDAPLLATGKVFVTGRYSESEAPHLIRREQPDVLWLPSVWPETWCYALDHALGTGLPVIAFNLGAIAERLRATGTGELLPLKLAPRHINDRLVRYLESPAIAVADIPRFVQSRPSTRQSNDKMSKAPPDEIPMKNNDTQTKPIQDVRDQGMSASVQVLPLPAGLYLFSVKTAAPAAPRVNGELSLPAVHVGLGPGVQPEQVEFIAGPNTHGAWLFAPGDLLVTKVNRAGATLVMTSVRAPGGDVLSIKVERLESRAEAATVPESAGAPAAPPATTTVRAPGPASPVIVREKPYVPVQIGVHVRSRGDLTFADSPWAGRVAPGLWIESFSVRPLEGITAQDIEYKALTGSGFETPWLSDDKMCGTKGMAVPLVGFALRLKGVAGTQYDCEYSGYFQSGATVGPLRNGAPCRSTVANDPLEGIQVRLLKRGAARDSADVLTPAKSPAAPKGRRRGAADTTAAGPQRADQIPQPARRP